VSLLVNDLVVTAEFYNHVLGLKENTSRPDLGYAGAWFDIGSQQLHLLELPNPGEGLTRPEHAGRDFHFAIYIKDINEIVKKLNNAGITFTRSRSGRTALFCRDPDNNGIEFIQI
jgi:glyoxylase I family protein